MHRRAFVALGVVLTGGTAANLQGAIFASLDDDLASPHVPGSTGRHPLPEKSAWLDTLSGWGIAPGHRSWPMTAGWGSRRRAVCGGC